ncbi:MAG: hypothetical protein AAGA23_19395 [Pseudomonadota bacterium]
MSNVKRLRELLGVEADRAAADKTAERLSEKDQRTADLAEVLPDAFRQRSKDPQMHEALRDPVEKTLKQSVTENPQELADVLFPVMGPAIRRAISEALRSALEGLNQALQAGFSARSMKWRVESWRTGVPFREVVLRHTVPYRISEALLIHRDSGLLIQRVGDLTDEQALDRDAVAGMLTAVQDFVADSTGDADGELSSAELGGRVLWVLTGPIARLALILEGQPPLSLRIGLRDHLAGMHQHCGGYLGSYAGEPAPQDLHQRLEAVLETATPADDEAPKRPPWVLLCLLGAIAVSLVAGLGWWAFSAWQTSAAWQRLEAAINAQPGLVWVSADRAAEPPLIQVLADPAAPSPDSVLRRFGPPLEDAQVKITPFVSAEPEMVRLRIGDRLGPLPDQLVMEVQGNTLRLSGRVPASWYQELEAFLSHAVLAVDASAVEVIEERDEEL